MGNSNKKDVIIIGAGQAGLSLSYHLQQNQMDHVVFERGQIGDAWTKRWDSFALNSPNALNLLPDESLDGIPWNGFISGKQFASRLADYAAKYQLPVITNSTAVSLEADGDMGFSLTLQRDGERETWTSKQIIIATGGQTRPCIPALSKSLSDSTVQMHSEKYRNPSSLPEGAVLIVGSATSGVQIAEELCQAGRKVFLATSAVARVPRRYRGRDTMEWMNDMHFFDKPTTEAEPFELNLKAPLMSGLGELGHTVSLQFLQKQGVVLLGYLKSVNDNQFTFDNNLLENIKFGDGFSMQVKQGIDQFIAGTGISAPPAEVDEADIVADPNSIADPILVLDGVKENIKTVIWATGFAPDMSWIRLPVLDQAGFPIHKEGVSPVPNIYFAGLPWQRNLKSSLILGAAEDAEALCKIVLKNRYETLAASA